MNKETNWLDLLRQAAHRRDETLALFQALCSLEYQAPFITITGKNKDLMDLLGDAIRAGYGEAPAAWCIKLFLERN